MPTVAASIAVAIIFLWLGMVIAISFLEAPLKFRAPGITIPLGLGIGRLVFRALNTVEAVLAVVLVVAIIIGELPPATVVTGSVAVVMLGIQIIAVRPALSRRTDAVLADPAAVDGPSSHAHLYYVGLEIIKFAGLVIAGAWLLAG